MAGLDPATQPPRVGAANKRSHVQSERTFDFLAFFDFLFDLFPAFPRCFDFPCLIVIQRSASLRGNFR